MPTHDRPEGQPSRVDVGFRARADQVQVSDVDGGRKVHVQIGDNSAHVWMVDTLDAAEELFTAVLAKLGAVRAARQLAREQACLNGTHSHPMSPVEQLPDDGGQVVECTSCRLQFVDAGDGALAPVLDRNGALTPALNRREPTVAS